MKLLIARFNGKDITSIPKPNPGKEEHDALAMQDIENGWTRTTAERPNVAG